MSKKRNVKKCITATGIRGDFSKSSLMIFNGGSL